MDNFIKMANKAIVDAMDETTSSTMHHSFRTSLPDMKAALYLSMKKKGISKSELARKISTHELEAWKFNKARA